MFILVHGSACTHIHVLEINKENYICIRNICTVKMYVALIGNFALINSFYIDFNIYQ